MPLVGRYVPFIGGYVTFCEVHHKIDCNSLNIIPFAGWFAELLVHTGIDFRLQNLIVLLI